MHLKGKKERIFRAFKTHAIFFDKNKMIKTVKPTIANIKRARIPPSQKSKLKRGHP